MKILKFRADVSHPPLVCAGRRQLKWARQALIVGQKCEQNAHFCRFCGCFHLSGTKGR